MGAIKKHIRNPKAISWGCIMKFAFCLFNYFPYGGLQRDFMKIAEECLSRNHSLEVFTMDWQGEKPSLIPVTLVSTSGFTNHGRVNSYIKSLPQHLNNSQFDAVIGFNKMPGLNVYYAADTCYTERMASRNFLYRFMPRYRSYSRNEAAVFSKNSSTEIIMISPHEQTHFINHYQTPEHRFHLLPPSITQDHILPIEEHANVRASVRKALGFSEEHHLLLMVASRFKTKGLDRTLHAMAALPRTLLEKTCLLVAGHDDSAPFLRIAKQLNLLAHVKFLGGISNVPQMMVASDLLLNPAYLENTGTVLIEAMANGLPVLASAVCGYRDHIIQADAGNIIPEPFDVTSFTQMIQFMISEASPSLYQSWRFNGLNYTKQFDLHSLAKNAVDILEAVARGRG
jgi:UDP-glucose:(heptosyl)LPS alpha-1,3-glucosyltransferase